MKTKDIVDISLFATLLAICAWICIPTAVPFTLQTFAVFLAILVLGGKRGIIVICIYLFLGIIGVPVFSRGTAGIGIMLGSTGGYMIGWIFIGIIMSFIEKADNKKWIQIVGLVLGLSVCYLFGSLWFVRIYVKSVGEISFFTALGMCVIPFIIPDLLKMWLAWIISKRIKNVIRAV